ncbi:histidine kinase [Paenibacillus macquariensis subsp. defensor]|nr:histidine kinase [Paenibacillus macquariensis subsp. defensor]
MNRKVRTMIVALIVILMASTNIVFASNTIEERNHSTEITRWQFMWDQSPGEVTKNMSGIPPLGTWTWCDSNQVIADTDHQSDTVWLKFRLPPIDSSDSAILIDKIYAKDISIFLDNEKIYENNRSHTYDANRILLPVKLQDAGKELVMRVHSERGRLGMAEQIIVGNYHTLLNMFVKDNLIDIIFGSSIIFIAVVMFICTFFLRREQMSDWLSLAIVLISIGTLIITYSPYLYTHYGAYGEVYTTLFDIALLTFFPGLTYIFETMIGKGYRGFISKFRKFQMMYSLLCLAVMVINMLLNNSLYSVYYVVSVTILGVLIIIQGVILLVHAAYYAIKGNKDAIIMATGFAIFSSVVIAEFIWFYSQHGNYEIFLWKWGVIGFVIALIVLLGRKFALNHRRVVEYSKELERFNNELQRSEKMDIISELAASVAHEVRNPLQVTRGFLQLLEEKSQEKEKGYLQLALEELDRASNIITDFLTFAKPGLEQITLLDISEEFKHVEGILLPLANFEGGTVYTNIPPGLMIHGNSSKFKQALINMIKNSIEALVQEGHIRIWAYQEEGQVVVHIRDNGEGMDPEEIRRLGEPYYSKKTKGTGLGLMVTFRIIEAMEGNVIFNSEKGVGTEAIIRFPAAYHDEES